jgi:hypothetical protein
MVRAGNGILEKGNWSCFIWLDSDKYRDRNRARVIENATEE